MNCKLVLLLLVTLPIFCQAQNGIHAPRGFFAGCSFIPRVGWMQSGRVGMNMYNDTYLSHFGAHYELEGGYSLPLGRNEHGLFSISAAYQRHRNLGAPKLNALLIRPGLSVGSNVFFVGFEPGFGAIFCTRMQADEVVTRQLMFYFDPCIVATVAVNHFAVILGAGLGSHQMYGRTSEFGRTDNGLDNYDTRYTLEEMRYLYGKIGIRFGYWGKR